MFIVAEYAALIDTTAFHFLSIYKPVHQILVLSASTSSEGSCSQTHICSQTRYWLPYEARFGQMVQDTVAHPTAPLLLLQV